MGSSRVGTEGPGRELNAGMPRIERVRLEGLLPQPISHYCDAVRAGDTLYISGMVAMDRDGQVVGKGDAHRQAEQIFENIKLVLDHVGIDFSRVTSVLVHLTDMNDRAVINPVRARYFGDHRPASTLVQVSALIHPDVRVEITCTAHLGD